MFLRARYLDLTVGRFLTEDPGPAYNSIPRSLHIYIYGWNDPVNLRDPNGRQVPPPRYCRPGSICYTGTSGGQVMPSQVMAYVPLEMSAVGYWEVWIYRRPRFISIYDELTVESPDCVVSAAAVLGESWSGHNLTELMGNWQAGNSTNYLQFEGRATAQVGIPEMGTVGMYGQVVATVDDPDMTSFSDMSASRDYLGSNLQFEVEYGLGITAGHYGSSVEVSNDTLSLDLSAHLWTGGIAFTSADEKWVMVPSLVGSRYRGREDALALERFDAVVRPDDTDSFSWYAYDRRWQNMGQTQFYADCGYNISTFLIEKLRDEDRGIGGNLPWPDVYMPFAPSEAWY